MANKKPAVSNAVLIAVVVAVVAATGGFLYYQKISKAKPQVAVLTPEAKAYVHNLKILDSDMKAAESFAGVVGVVEITGKIKNEGDRPVGLVEIYCNFFDGYEQMVLRERVPIVSAKMGVVKPGETKPFRLAFDTIPPSWNQSMPKLTIAQLQFAND